MVFVTPESQNIKENLEKVLSKQLSQNSILGPGHDIFQMYYNVQH
jgi:hypothetical protein